MKESLKSNRVLTHFDDQLPLLLECDASPYGLGAVLSHWMPDGSEKPVGFASLTLTLKSEKNYSHLDKEALAIIFGFVTFGHRRTIQHPMVPWREWCRCLRRASSASRENLSLNTRLSRFLFKYRLMLHTSTGVSPAELMFGRKLRSQLDLLRPSMARTAHLA